MPPKTLFARSACKSIFSHWLPEGYAYVTPHPATPNGYDSALKELVSRDLVFSYENDIGIVDASEVSSP